MRMLYMAVAAAVLGGVLGGLSAEEVADESAKELARIAGRFERKFTNSAGVEFRVVREMAGNQSVVTLYDDVGHLVESHTSTVQVEKKGGVRILSYGNSLFTAGPRKGHVRAITQSYLYRLEGDTFIEARGLHENDPQPPAMFAWKRVKDGE